CLPRNPPLRQSSFNASATTPGSRISPFSTAPGGSGTWAARTSDGGSLAEISAARTAVEPTSSPILVLLTGRCPPRCGVVSAVTSAGPGGNLSADAWVFATFGG